MSMALNGSRRPLAKCASADSRKPPIRSAKWKLRLMVSLRQNGSAVAPSRAGRTITSLWVMRRICQFWVPRVKVWPVVASQTNSSSSSPMVAPLSAWRN